MRMFAFLRPFHLFSYMSGALALDLPFCDGTLKLGKYYIQY